MLDPRDEVIIEYIHNDTLHLEKSGSREVAVAINTITSAIAENSKMSSAGRTKALALLKEIGNQVALPPQSRSVGVIRSVLGELTASMTAIRNLADVWSTWGPTIARFFSG